MARKKIIEIVLDTETTGLDFTKEKMVEFTVIGFFAILRLGWFVAF